MTRIKCWVNDELETNFRIAETKVLQNIWRGFGGQLVGQFGKQIWRDNSEKHLVQKSVDKCNF